MGRTSRGSLMKTCRDEKNLRPAASEAKPAAVAPALTYSGGDNNVHKSSGVETKA